MFSACSTTSVLGGSWSTYRRWRRGREEEEEEDVEEEEEEEGGSSSTHAAVVTEEHKYLGSGVNWEWCIIPVAACIHK